MSIKNNIDKTEQLANSLKERVDSINNTIVSNNGQSSNNLNEISNNINKMLADNYKKIAIIETTQTEGIDKYSPKVINIPLDITFIPSRVFVVLDYGAPDSYGDMYYNHILSNEERYSSKLNPVSFDLSLKNTDIELAVSTQIKNVYCWFKKLSLLNKR